MLLAHTFGATGPDVEFLVLAAAMFVLGVVFFFQETVKPMVSVVLLVLAFAATAGAFSMGGDGSDVDDGTPVASTATIRIVSPADGDEVPSGELLPIEVAVDGGEITTDMATDDPTMGHLHVFVDGQLVAMPRGDAAEVEFPEPGTYELTVEFTRADHRSFDPKVLSTVEVTAT
jgi:hypothetical protein